MPCYTVHELSVALHQQQYAYRVHGMRLCHCVPKHSTLIRRTLTETVTRYMLAA